MSKTRKRANGLGWNRRETIPSGLCWGCGSFLGETRSTVQELLRHEDVRTTMIYTHVLSRGGRGVRGPADSLWIAGSSLRVIPKTG